MMRKEIIHILFWLPIGVMSNNWSATFTGDIQSQEDNAVEVEPLLGEIAFSQYAPYSDKCPMMDGKRTATGCLATAMAQILAYYKYPLQMNGEKIEYVTEKYNIPVSWNCSATTFDWNNILNTYSENEVEVYTGNETVADEQQLIITGMRLYEELPSYIELSRLTSISLAELSGIVQPLLFDDKGMFIRPVGEGAELEKLRPKAGYTTNYFKHFVPNNLSDGTYRLYIGFKAVGSNEWSIINKATDENDIYTSPHSDCYMTLTKTGNYYSIDNRKFLCGYTPVQGDAIATLCAAAGAATHMEYGTEGSYANNNNMALGLVNYMGYDDKMFIISSVKFADKDWLGRIIQAELQEQRPVYCCGSVETGGSHAFVIDGCKSIEGVTHFHINWGWNGQDNGYYPIDRMEMSTGKNFSHSYSLTMGIKPMDNSDQGFVFAAQNFSASVRDDSIVISVNQLINYTIKPFSGDLKVYIIDDNDVEYVLKSYPWENWKEFAGVGTWNINIAIPSSIDSGKYKIAIRAKEKGSSKENEVLFPQYPVVMVEKETSNISSIKSSDINDSPQLYDLSGRRQNAPIKNTISILDGKKVFVK